MLYLKIRQTIGDDWETVYTTMNHAHIKKREIVAVDIFGRDNVLVTGTK